MPAALQGVVQAPLRGWETALLLTPALRQGSGEHGPWDGWETLGVEQQLMCFGKGNLLWASLESHVLRAMAPSGSGPC